MKTKKKW